MGLSGTLRAWDTSVAALLARGSCQICIFDNRGVGESDQPGPGYTLKDMAMDARELLQHLGWKEVGVVGVSMGGMIALQLACLDLELAEGEEKSVGALCLVSTTAGRSIPPLKGMWGVVRMMMNGKNGGVEKYVDRYCDLVFDKKWLAESPLDESATEHKTNRALLTSHLLHVHAVKGPQTAQGRLGQLRAISSHYVPPRSLAALASSSLPITVVTGTNDHLVRPSNSKYLADKLKCECHVFQGAGHGVLQERVKEVHDVLQECLQKNKTYVKLAPEVTKDTAAEKIAGAEETGDKTVIVTEVGL
ncbi:Alpha/Beta hydrolase protein [Gaertneriomyces semiglobifer]|nr:Alpha/Beta hydrolase protein [Gaertneriomyces semiglobifer]